MQFVFTSKSVNMRLDGTQKLVAHQNYKNTDRIYITRDNHMHAHNLINNHFFNLISPSNLRPKKKMLVSASRIKLHTQTLQYDRGIIYNENNGTHRWYTNTAYAHNDRAISCEQYMYILSAPPERVMHLCNKYEIFPLCLHL